MQVIHLNQKAANAYQPGTSTQHASTLGTQPDISTLSTTTPEPSSGVQLSSTPLLGGSGAATAQPLVHASGQQHLNGGSSQLASGTVGGSSQFARYSEPSTAASDAGSLQGKAATGTAEQPLAGERSLRSIYSLGRYPLLHSDHHLQQN